MSIHKIFAENLRAQCMRVGTIAEVCRNASVNRQQFNRYLSGAAIPNAGTLSRISKALKIGEAELFSPPDPKFGDALSTKRMEDDSVPGALTDFHGSIERCIRLTDPQIVQTFRGRSPSMPDAIYYCYFPLQNMSQFLVRSVLRIKHVGDITHFKRYTRLKSPSESTSDIAVGKHFGIVYADANHCHFIGINQFTPHNISLLSIQQRNWSQGNVSIGLALMQGTRDPFACCICIERIGKSTAILKHAIRRAGIVSLDDQSVNPIVASLYSVNNGGSSMQLGVPSLDQALVSAYKIKGMNTA